MSTKRSRPRKSRGKSTRSPGTPRLILLSKTANLPCSHAVGHRLDEQSRPAWLHRRSFLPYISRTGNNGSAFAGLNGNTHVLQSQRRCRDGCRPVLNGVIPDRSRAIAGTLAAEKLVPRLPARSRPTAACSWASSSAWMTDRRQPPCASSRRWRSARSSSRTRNQRRHAFLIGSSSEQLVETSTTSQEHAISAAPDPKIVVPAIGSAFGELNYHGTLMKNPRHVFIARGGDSAATTVTVHRGPRRRRRGCPLRLSVPSMAVVHRVVLRQFRRSGR